jgi:predicted ATP-grasp superfamily ATP-dependent carboligase
VRLPPQSDYSVPALVLGAPWHTTLAVIRALADAGVPQLAVGTASSYAARSRWHRPLLKDHERQPSPETLAEFLARLPNERMVLFPCGDAWLAAVARLEPGLATRFPTSIGPVDSVDICLDKGRFAELLVRCDVPHPRTVSLGPDGDPWTISRTFVDPFLKPVTSDVFAQLFGSKGLKVVNAVEVREQARAARRAGVGLLIQELIPGPATAHYYVDGFVDRTGSVRSWFARQRIRSYPQPFGNSSCMTTIPCDRLRAPIAALESLFQAIRYRGVFSAEFMHDPRDGVFKLIEVNARAWGGLALAVSCGVNVIEMAYRDALGLPVQPAFEYPAGRCWVYHLGDAIVLARQLRAGRLEGLTGFRMWIGAVQAIIRLDDPLPAIAHFAQQLRRVASQAVGRLAPAPGPPSG